MDNKYLQSIFMLLSMDYVQWKCGNLYFKIIERTWEKKKTNIYKENLTQIKIRLSRV